MKPTQEQLENLWKSISDSFDRNTLETKQDIIDFAEDESLFTYDILLECLDIMADSKGNIIKL